MQFIYPKYSPTGRESSQRVKQGDGPFRTYVSFFVGSTVQYCGKQKETHGHKTKPGDKVVGRLDGAQKRMHARSVVVIVVKNVKHIRTKKVMYIFQRVRNER